MRLVSPRYQIKLVLIVSAMLPVMVHAAPASSASGVSVSSPVSSAPSAATPSLSSTANKGVDPLKSQTKAASNTATPSADSSVDAPAPVVVGQTPVMQPPTGHDDAPLIYIQNAGSAKVECDSTRSGSCLLIMEKLNPELIYFSDRKSRVVGQVDNQTFKENWTAGRYPFSQYPPQAALLARTFSFFGGLGVHTDVFLLSKPQYNATEKTMTYQVRAVSGYVPKTGIYKNVSLLMVQRVDPAQPLPFTAKVPPGK